jgi:chromosome segregation ATPase
MSDWNKEQGAGEQVQQKWSDEIAQLRSDLARVTQERDALAGKAAELEKLLSTECSLSQNTMQAMFDARRERDTALSDLARVTQERDAYEREMNAAVAAHERLAVQVDEDCARRHALARRSMDDWSRAYKAGPDDQMVRRSMDERDADLTAMRHRAERAEAELAEARKPRTLTDDEQRAVAERIAAWLDDLHPSAWKMRDFGVQNERVEAVAKMLAADIRAGAWRKETT